MRRIMIAVLLFISACHARPDKCWAKFDISADGGTRVRYFRAKDGMECGFYVFDKELSLWRAHNDGYDGMGYTHYFPLDTQAKEFVESSCPVI